MPDYATQLRDATRRLDALDAFNLMRVPQAESLAPLWFTTAEGMQYLDALQRGDTDASLTIWDQAYGDALNAWIDLLWQAPSPAIIDVLPRLQSRDSLERPSTPGGGSDAY